MKSYNKPVNQSGAALIISLVILIAMTLIAVTSMKGTATQLAMAGNLRETSIAFQAAEAGLRSAEAVVESSNNISNINGGAIAEATADPNYFDLTSWAGAELASIDLSSVGVYSTPQYLIKFVGKNAADPLAAVNTGAGYGGPPKGAVVSIFRITSRASGQVGNTFRTVQSHYGIEY